MSSKKSVAVTTVDKRAVSNDTEIGRYPRVDRFFAKSLYLTNKSWYLLLLVIFCDLKTSEF